MIPFRLWRPHDAIRPCRWVFFCAEQPVPPGNSSGTRKAATIDPWYQIRLTMHIEADKNSIMDCSARITERIESRIRLRLGGQLRDLHVAIHDGSLVLRGRTRTHHAKQLVLQAAMESSELPILAADIRVGNDSGLGRPHATGSRGGSSPDDATRECGKPPRETLTSFVARMGEVRSR